MNIWEKYYNKGGKGARNWKLPDKRVVDIVPFLKKKSAYKVLDLGCGLGRNTIFLAKKGFFVIGLDIAMNSLEYLQKVMKKNKLKNYLLLKHDMKNLPFPNMHFDAIISIDTIHHDLQKDMIKTVKEIFRILKKDGMALITVKSKKDWSFGKGKKFEPNTYARPKGEHQAGILHHFLDENEIRQIFSKFKILGLKETQKPKKNEYSTRWEILLVR